MKDVPKEQADRIFRSCDQRGDGRISLVEFRSTIQKGKEKLKSWEEAQAQQQPQQQQQQKQQQGRVNSKLSWIFAPQPMSLFQVGMSK